MRKDKAAICPKIQKKLEEYKLKSSYTITTWSGGEKFEHHNPLSHHSHALRKLHNLHLSQLKPLKPLQSLLQEVRKGGGIFHDAALTL
ncbi:hypothetical protein D8674_034722 [Pyrus ussuriensis x Pyrus communis]|uniref:Uncharacterized protein n=1 Tax=Pyrus ussuriensis x Pyrus communis TaxID=2448454 RepID=A0A5N5GAH0_9ROSA|nr:hypothetical protein D8674_034722 [Pyrus ussuriensis x Pyrus communis]